MTYDDTRAELQNTGETLDVLLGRASEQVEQTQNASDRIQGLEVKATQLETMHQTHESLVTDKIIKLEGQVAVQSALIQGHTPRLVELTILANNPPQAKEGPAQYEIGTPKRDDRGRDPLQPIDGKDAWGGELGARPSREPQTPGFSSGQPDTQEQQQRAPQPPPKREAIQPDTIDSQASMTQQVTLMAQVVATALQQAGIGGSPNPTTRIGPRAMNGKDLLPAGFKQWNGNYLEFGPWWTRLKNALGSTFSEWRAILQRLHEFGKLRIENSDLDLIIGSGDHNTQKAHCS